MKKYVVLEKKIGETPLHCLEQWRAQHPNYATTPLTYAGRLDPMASGKLLILIGDECKQAKKYQNLDKEYKIEVLLDIGTDTGDLLGLSTPHTQQTKVHTTHLQQVLKQEIGVYEHPYPAFSSKTVGGKPLFQYALEGTLDTITIPTHQETIHALQLETPYTFTTGELNMYIQNFLAKVPHSTHASKALGADFRIASVTKAWQHTLRTKRAFVILPITATVGSGTYMRTLAQRIGTALNTSACALSIHRTIIGKYSTIGPFSIWSKKFIS